MKPRRPLPLVALVLLLSAGNHPAFSQVSEQEFAALKARIAELEAKQNETWLTQERTDQIKAIVQDVLADAKTHSQFADGPNFGYNTKDSFFIQSADKNYKLSIGGLLQVRYEFAQSNAYNGRTLPSRTVINSSTGNGGVTQTVTKITPSDPGNSSAFDIRRARINFAGNVFTPDLTFKFEGDFYGGSSGSFTVTDAFVAYRFTDLIRVKAGSYKVPFAKAELTPDPNTTFSERSEVLFPFDPVRALGVSLYGDIIRDQLGYEVAVNDGGKNSNILRQADAVGATPNLDNRLSFYARVQWAGSGKLADFSEESDLRGPGKNQDFIWLLGAAAGYESANATNNSFPSPQTTDTVTGLSSPGAGFANTYNLNGDLFRGTLDWSAKWQGLSLLAAGFVQQVNANPGNTSITSATSTTTGPYGATDSSFFQWSGYGQIGYFVIPQKLELVARAGVLGTEGYNNEGEFYSVGANYYFYGQNLKIVSDITYTPEAPYTDASSSLLQNTHDLIGRVQLQLKF